jgi:3-deoxy-D-manno-octulosonic-acid transferase
MLLVDVRLAPQRGWLRALRGGMAAALLSRFDRILAQDPETARHLQQIAGPHVAIEVTGRIEETSDPLKCNEAERAALAEQLRARPIWFAVACPQAEEEAILAAHAHVLRLAHRMLLILLPSDPARLEPLCESCQREGWVVARRAEDEEPEAEVQVLLTEGEAELGLWYRLAPVTFMGGTLMPGASGRNPYEPAALGSAILHGPHPGPYPDAYARLDEAHAARLVANPAALAEAVADLIAPDKAAQLAHNAWAASSGGAEVTERVLQIILDLMDAHAPAVRKEA